jgi:hypothetical protein
VNPHPLSSRLAVCSWSLQPSSPQELVAAIQATGVEHVRRNIQALGRVADIAAARVLAEGIEA